MDRAPRRLVAMQLRGVQMLNQRPRGVQSRAVGGRVGMCGKPSRRSPRPCPFSTTVCWRQHRPRRTCCMCDGLWALFTNTVWQGPTGMGRIRFHHLYARRGRAGSGWQKLNFPFKRLFAELCHRLVSCTSTNSRLLPASRSHDSEEARL